MIAHIVILQYVCLSEKALHFGKSRIQQANCDFKKWLTYDTCLYVVSLLKKCCYIFLRSGDSADRKNYQQQQRTRKLLQAFLAVAVREQH